MKTISVRQMAAVKRVAQNVNFAVTKKNKIAEQINKLNEEYKALTEEIEGHEAGIIKLTGHTSEELVVKVIETTSKVDKEGRPIKITKYEPRKDFVVFNEKTKVYEIYEQEISESVDTKEVDDTEKVEEIAVNTLFKEEDSSNIPFME